MWFGICRHSLGVNAVTKVWTAQFILPMYASSHHLDSWQSHRVSTSWPCRSQFSGIDYQRVGNSTHITLLSTTLTVAPVNILRPRQNGHRFSDDIFKCIFASEHYCILIKISLKCLLKGAIDNISALVQIMAWHRTGDKPLSEPMVTEFGDTYVCVSRYQWLMEPLWRMYAALIQVLASVRYKPSLTPMLAYCP